jgi:hypothetical protein
MNNLPPSTKTREEMASLYGVSRRTFYNWLKNNGIELPRTLLTPAHQRRVFEAFGEPPSPPPPPPCIKQ